MNSLAHGWRFLGDPYFLAGTTLPDWLILVDRQVRVRRRQAAAALDDPDSRVAALAAGIVQHHVDDDWFHATPAFAQLVAERGARLRQRLGDDPGFRPALAAHIAIEMLLDDALAERDPERLHRYYTQLERIDPQVVQQTVNRLSARPTTVLAPMIPRFINEKYLYDYADDQLVLVRINRIWRRVGLVEMPQSVVAWIAETRRLVRRDAGDLLLHIWSGADEPPLAPLDQSAVRPSLDAP
jgi:hypothetical protein